MATVVKMKHKDTGIQKDGFFGFSWTTLIFGFFVPLFRGDFVTFLGGLLIVSVIGAATFGFGVFIAFICMAFMYNKYYTTKLIEKGFVFCDSPEINKQAARALGMQLDSPVLGYSNHSETSSVNQVNANIVKKKMSIADELDKLANLRDKGVLNEDEFQVQKRKILESI